MTDLRATLCGVALPGPLVLASGIWGSSAATLVRAARAGAGAVTSKSCSLEPRTGHPNPTVLPWECGLINAVGLTNPGAHEERHVLEAARAELRPLGAALIASVFGGDVASFVGAVAALAPAPARAARTRVAALLPQMPEASTSGPGSATPQRVTRRSVMKRSGNRTRGGLGRPRAAPDAPGTG